MPDLLKKSSYRYDLPRHLIAQYPLRERHKSRLMVLDRRDKSVSHKSFSEVKEYFSRGDVLVLNKTRVIPARLYGSRENGTRVEVFLLNERSEGVWACLVHPGKRLKRAQRLIFSDELSGFVTVGDHEGLREIRFEYSGDFWNLLDKHGHIPLPPYIEREDEAADRGSYQTVYASERGSVAAPTAGFHFTEELLAELQDMGVRIAEIVLHVGLGTFRPVKTDNISDHKMHSEFCLVTHETAELVNQTRQRGGRIFAVGTTSVRTLESFAQNGMLQPGRKWTKIFIYPGRRFEIVDALLTNFHLPESTLLMLVAAFAGYDLAMQAYQTAVRENYRFFSYGDAMLIL